MKGIVFPRKCFREIWITFPIGVYVAIVQPRIPVELRSTVARDPAMWQRITVRMADGVFAWSSIAYEIAFARRITPFALRVPVPRLHKQFGILAVTDWTPASFVKLLQLIGLKKNIGRVARDPVQGCAQGAQRTERVGHMARSSINLNSLC